MKIEQLEIIPAVMIREDPTWRHALSKPGGESDVQGFVVKLIADDGLVGLGYNHASAHYGVSLGALKGGLEAYAPLLEGQDPFNTERIFGLLNSVLAGNNEAKAAIDIALHDLQAKALGVPLYALLGGPVRKEIPVIRILALKAPEEMAANALKLVGQGYRYLKVKLDGNPGLDLDRVREVRKAVGDDIHLTVDANQSYFPKTAIDTLKRMQKYRIDLCEQPVRADDRKGLSAVARAVDCMVEAHECASTLEDIFELVNGHVADGINLSIQHLGGLQEAKTAAAICRLGNFSLRVQATGSRLLAAACMHFVAATANVSYACELGEFSRLLEDPFDGLEVENGVLRVPSSPGLGVSLRNG